MAENGLPNTFVPGRNLLFFTLAGALAYRRGLRVIVGGMCETDYSGYPDCRDDTLKAQQVALSLGLDRRITIETPLMWLDKAETFALAQDLGGEASARPGRREYPYLLSRRSLASGMSGAMAAAAVRPANCVRAGGRSSRRRPHDLRRQGNLPDPAGRGQSHGPRRRVHAFCRL